MKRYIAAASLLIALTTAAFWPVGSHEFINFDDDGYIYSNHTVLRGLTAEGLLWAFSMESKMANWHPLTWISHMVDVELFGLDAGKHHLASLFLHVLNTLLLFGVLCRMTGAFWRSFIVAAFFAVHPLHVESVAWAAERKDVLSATFWFLSLWAYATYVARSSLAKYVLALLLFTFGLMAKPMVITLPFVLLLLDFWPLGRFTRGENTSSFAGLIFEKIPFFLLAAVSGVITYLSQRSGGAVPPLEVLPVGARLSNALLSYLSYIGKTIWPLSLGVYYPHSGKVAPILFLTAALLFFVVTFAGMWSMRKKAPFLLVGMLWYLGMLVPVLGVLQVGGQAMADRYTYLPLIGLFIIAVWGVDAILPRGRGRHIIMPVAMTILLTMLGLLCRSQVSYWRDSVTLYERTLRVAGKSSSVLNNLGNALLDLGRTKEAIDNLVEARKLAPWDSDILLNLGVAQDRQGNTSQSIQLFRKATTADPTNSRAYNNLGNVLARLGRHEEAVTAYRDALALDPEYANAHYNLAIVLGGLGAAEESAAHYRKALSLEPDMLDALNNLAWMRATSSVSDQRDGDEAVLLAERLCSLTDYANPLYLDTLAAAYAEAGDYTGAVRTIHKAIDLSLTSGNANNVSEYKKRLDSYQKGKSYREGD